MAGRLHIVATPIGNLEDITLRALRVLKEVDLVAAEDTRRTRGLLAHFGIGTPLLSFHQHNSRARIPDLLARLEQGLAVALVTDAGTPLLSDPGRDLVQACVAAGLRVETVPGASAPLALAMVAGFEVLPWTVFGFPPVRGKDLDTWVASVARIEHSVTFLEAPHRILKTLECLASKCGERPIVVGRELTKLHEELYRGTAAEVLERGIATLGEFVVMLGPMAKSFATPLVTPSDVEIYSEFGVMTEKASRKEAIRSIANKYGLSTRSVYAAVERAKPG